MNRRDLLKYLGCAMAGFAAGGGVVAAVHRYGDYTYAALPPPLAALADDRFVMALPDMSAADLLAGLERVGVFRSGLFSGQHFDVAKLAVDSESHRLVEWDGFHYTEPELMLYAYVARSRLCGLLSAR